MEMLKYYGYIDQVKYLLNNLCGNTHEFVKLKGDEGFLHESFH